VQVYNCGAKQDNRPGRQNRLGKKWSPEVIAIPTAQIRFYLHKEFRDRGIRLSLHKEFRAAEVEFSLHKEFHKKNHEKLMVRSFVRKAK